MVRQWRCWQSSKRFCQAAILPWLDRMGVSMREARIGIPELERLCAQAAAGGTIRFDRGILQPVFVGSQLVAALVVRPCLDPDRPVPAEHVLRCLDVTLTLVLRRAPDTRDVVSETLDRYREINLLYRIGDTIGASLDV